MVSDIDAVKNGTKEAIITILNNSSDMSGEDIIKEIREGVKETVQEGRINRTLIRFSQNLRF